MAANPSIQLGTDGNWAIKEDNLLAYKKDGTRFFNKEFDFTRGSLATFVDKDGLIKVSGVTDTELVTNGSFDTDSDWNIVNNTGTASEIINGYARIKTDGTYTQIDQTNVTIGTKSYKLQYTVLETDGGSLGFIITGNQTVSIPNTVGTHTYYFVAHSTSIVFKRFSGALDIKLDNVSVKEIQTDVPRIDFTNDTTGHLLLEPQSTNLITHSEDFSSLDIRNNAVVTSDAILSPSGLLNADEITFDGTSLGRVQEAITVTDNQSYTISLYLKNKDLSDKTQVWIGFSAAAQGQFVTITDEWQRYDITTTSDNTTEYPRIQFDGTGSLYAWGFQVEQLSYATSYIPTNGSSVTRNADACNNSGTAQDFNSEEGVLYAEISAFSNNLEYRILSVSDGSTNNRAYLQYTNLSNQIKFVYKVGSVTQAGIGTGNFDIVDYHKIACKWKANDFALWIDGNEIGTDTSGSVNPAGTFTELNFDDGAGNTDFYGKTKNLKVFKRAMSSGELYLLTVTQYQSYQEMATALNYTL